MHLHACMPKSSSSDYPHASAHLIPQSFLSPILVVMYIRPKQGNHTWAPAPSILNDGCCAAPFTHKCIYACMQHASSPFFLVLPLCPLLPLNLQLGMRTVNRQVAPPRQLVLCGSCRLQLSPHTAALVRLHTRSSRMNAFDSALQRRRMPCMLVRSCNPPSTNGR